MDRKGITHDFVISAAADLADSEGFESISVSALARRVGVQPASLYSHVRDRAAVLNGVHQVALAELADRIATETSGRSGRDALGGFADAHRGYALEHPGRWAALQRPAAASTVSSDAAGRLVSFTSAVLRAYALDEAELVHATRFVGAAINGYLALERWGSFGHSEVSIVESWTRSIDALDRSLRSWPEASKETS
ncbi:TetR/AcrR family transcriptional regulator [Microbacterium phyllosphaerae]|uniref:TetR/AcrR family transcriptional regulator n=1 Tax=Microbacterium phyllosphaerae TaxID=124798 RepID=UPI003D6465CB